jgi:general secretion pathway protein I
MTVSKCQRRRGFSLLEVILAIAILAGAMVMLGDLLRIAGRHATATSELTRAQLHCQSIISQIAAGILPPESVQGAPMETDPNWTYSIDVQTLQLEGLLSVQVTVAQNIDARQQPLSATLTRWMIDPDLALLEEAEQAEAAEGGDA